jgi:glutamate decarboxylase
VVFAGLRPDHPAVLTTRLGECKLAPARVEVARNIRATHLVEESRMTLHRMSPDPEAISLSDPLATTGASSGVAKHSIPTEEMDPRTVYQLIHDELLLDGNARQNMATFVTTWMNDYANRLFAENVGKNSIDKDEYPQTAEIERRCVNMVANLWNAGPNAIGCSAVGSSEAVMLAGMATKWKWRERMRAAGRPVDKPNLVMSSTVQVVWEKFCRYWEVEPRYVPVQRERLELSGAEAVKHVDANTIGVIGILGVTHHVSTCS